MASAGKSGATTFDIEAAVKDWAWCEYDNTATKKLRQLRKKENKQPGRYVAVNIDWTGVQFSDKTLWPHGVKQETFGVSKSNSECVQKSPAAGASVVESASRSRLADSGYTHVSILFQTKFTNNTDGDQEYTVRTEKTTTSTCSTEIETCWTRSLGCGISLKSPGDILELSAGIQKDYSLTNVNGQTFEEQLSWGVESVIKVQSRHVASAELEVTEKKYEGNFEITTTMKGMVFVTFTNPKDNNSFLTSTAHELAEICKWYKQRETRKGVSLDFVQIDDVDGIVKITSKGRCKFRCGITQQVVVHQMSIE